MDSLCASFPTTVPRLPQSDTGNRLVRELTVDVTWRGLYACASLGLWSGRVAPTHCPLLPQPHRDTGQDPEAAHARNPSLQHRVQTEGLISWRKAQVEAIAGSWKLINTDQKYSEGNPALEGLPGEAVSQLLSLCRASREPFWKGTCHKRQRWARYRMSNETFFSLI